MNPLDDLRRAWAEHRARLLAVAAILLGTYIGLTGRPLSGSTIAAVLLIGAGGAVLVRHVARGAL